MNYNPEHMGAWLLGYDVAAIANENTIKAITGLLQNKKNLVLQMAKSLTGNENASDAVEVLLTSFMQGVQGANANRNNAAMIFFRYLPNENNPLPVPF